MKNMIKSLVVSALLVGSLSADYKLVLTDKDGVQTEECIKSYSFSNNLESLAKKNSVGVKDVYSEEETMTNKVYNGKPIYRKIVTLPSNYVVDGTKYEYAYYLNPAKDIEQLISARQIGAEHLGATSRGVTNQFYVFYEDRMGYILGQNQLVLFKGSKVILEYTKTTDVADSSSTEFKSYLHYVPSASQTEEVTTKNMDELGVQLLKDYSYDSSTQSCVKNQ